MRGVVQGKAAPIHNKMRALFCWSANANLGKGGQRGIRVGRSLPLCVYEAADWSDD